MTAHNESLVLAFTSVTRMQSGTASVATLSVTQSPPLAGTKKLTITSNIETILWKQNCLLNHDKVRLRLEKTCYTWYKYCYRRHVCNANKTLLFGNVIFDEPNPNKI